MDIRQLSNDEKVDILINQIIEHNEMLFDQLQQIEDDWGGSGVWSMFEIINYPQYKEIIEKMDISCCEFGPGATEGIAFALGEVGITCIENVDICDTEQMSFNDQNEFSKFHSLREQTILKICNCDELAARINEVEHFIDNVEYYLIDGYGFNRFNNDEGDIYISFNHKYADFIECYVPIYEFINGEYDERIN